MKLSVGDWLILAVGLLVLAASLAHVPPYRDALNYFDPPKRLVWALIAVILAFARPMDDWKLVFRTPILSSACALLLWMTLRTVFRPHFAAEFEVLISWLMPLVLFILGFRLTPQSRSRFLPAILLFAALIQGGLMMAQYFGHDPLFADVTARMSYLPGRMIGTIGYQNQALDFIAVCAVSILLCAFSPVMRFMLFAVVIAVAGLTANRGGIVALVTAVLLSQAFLYSGMGLGPRRRFGFIVLGCSLIAIIISMSFLPATGGRFLEVLKGFRHSPAVQSRLIMADVGMKMFKEKPWTGWGAGEYAFQYLDRLPAALSVENRNESISAAVFAREAHNDILQFAAEFGVVGLVMLGMLIALILHALWRNRILNPALASAVLFVITYMAVASAVSFTWQTSMAGPLAAFLLGLYAAPECLYDGQTCSADGLRFRRFSCLACDVTLIIVTLFMIVWCSEDVFLNIAVPETLGAEGPACAESFVPGYACRYHAVIGAAYAGCGNHRKAQEELQRAFIGYRDILLYNNLGYTLSVLGKWKDAAVVYEKWAATGIGVNYSNALSNLSVAYEQTCEYGKAASVLERKMAIWPTRNANEIRRLAIMELQSGDAVKALKTLHRYEESCRRSGTPLTAEMDNLAGAVYRVLGRFAESEDRFRSALKKNPGLESAQRNLNGLMNRDPARSGNSLGDQM